LSYKSHKNNKFNNYYSSTKAVEESNRINKNSGTEQDGTRHKMEEQGIS